METQLMRNMQQSDASSVWSLPAGEAITLRIGRGGREFKVREGRAWLTLTARRGNSLLPSDIWVSAGERVFLPAGCQVVIEGWPEARFELLEPPLTASRVLRRGLRWLARQVPRSVPIGGVRA